MSAVTTRKQGTVVPTDTDKAYAAGIIDGEGHLGIHGRTGSDSYFQVHVAVGITNRQVLEWLAERWGGAVLSKDMTKRPDGRKAVFTWTLVCGAAVSFLEDVYPFLVVKKEQALLLRVQRAFTTNTSESSVSFESAPGRKRPRALVDVNVAIKSRVASLNAGTG